MDKAQPLPSNFPSCKTLGAGGLGGWGAGGQESSLTLNSVGAIHELPLLKTFPVSSPQDQPNCTKNGEGGIRTLGWVLRVHQQISNLPLSTTQPPLQGDINL